MEEEDKLSFADHCTSFACLKQISKITEIVKCWTEANKEIENLKQRYSKTIFKDCMDDLF